MINKHSLYKNFSIGFDPNDKSTIFSYWDEIFTSNRWSEGKFTQAFENKWGELHQLESVATSSWTGSALACMHYFKLQGKKVLCPTNTFMATPLAVTNAGAEVVFGDCNRDDLCLSFEAVEKAYDEHQISAVWMVHIGGHIAFEIKKIAKFCHEKGIVLLEDCAHAHGASWNGKAPGSWGDAGVYSFYATKTVSTGEGGILVTRHKELAEFAKKFRNYGKFEYDIHGLNFRMSEFTAALGLVQAERLQDIIDWKNEAASNELNSKYPNRLKFPEGMISGYYKYIVFDEIEQSTGKVYDVLCHNVMKHEGDFPNAEWAANNHWCVPLYYNPQ